MAPTRRLKSEEYAALIICRDFPEGKCKRQDCRRSHSLIDTARFTKLVGDISLPSVARRTHDKPIIIVEYPKGCLEKGLGQWEVKLCDGGPASLGGEGWSISVQPNHPMTSLASHLSEALSELELQIFGRHAAVPWPDRDPRGTCCMQFLQDKCHRNPCRYSHDLLDAGKVESLVSTAKRGMPCHCIPPSIRFICLAHRNEPLKWRIIFGEPGQVIDTVGEDAKGGTVVVEGTNLVAIFSALERRFQAAKYHTTCTKVARPTAHTPIVAPPQPAAAVPAAERRPVSSSPRSPPPSYFSVINDTAEARKTTQDYAARSPVQPPTSSSNRPASTAQARRVPARRDHSSNTPPPLEEMPKARSTSSNVSVILTPQMGRRNPREDSSNKPPPSSSGSQPSTNNLRPLPVEDIRTVSPSPLEDIRTLPPFRPARPRSPRPYSILEDGLSSARTYTGAIFSSHYQTSPQTSAPPRSPHSYSSPNNGLSSTSTFSQTATDEPPPLEDIRAFSSPSRAQAAPPQPSRPQSKPNDGLPGTRTTGGKTTCGCRTHAAAFASLESRHSHSTHTVPAPAPAPAPTPQAAPRRTQPAEAPNRPYYMPPPSRTETRQQPQEEGPSGATGVFLAAAAAVAWYFIGRK